MKKVIYAILICIIIAGIIVIATVGLNVDIIYSRNVELDIYLGKTFERADMQSLVNEVFPNERVIIQEIELFGDMCSITLKDNRSEEELNNKITELTTKINEKYELELDTEDVDVIHNPKIRISSIVIPYAVTLGISLVIILAFVGIRYKKLGVVKTIVSYILSIAGAELLLLSIIAITRIPVNRMIILLGLLLLVIVITILGLKNEKNLSDKKLAEKTK